MTMHDAQKMIGKYCRIHFHDAMGVEKIESMIIEDLQSVPNYGNYFIGDTKDIKLDEIVSIRVID